METVVVLPHPFYVLRKRKKATGPRIVKIWFGFISMCSSFTAVQLSNTFVVYEKTMLWLVELVTQSLSRLSVPLCVILHANSY